MYQKGMQGWMKHIDFILLDILCLNIAFVAAYATRNGLHWPYQSRDYVNLIVVLSLVDFAILIVNETMKNVLRRGYYREFAATVVSVKPPHGLNRGSEHETMSQNSKYLPCSIREIFVTLGDGQKWSKVCK